VISKSFATDSQQVIHGGRVSPIVMAHYPLVLTKICADIIAWEKAVVLVIIGRHH